ncbi:hypothetical protein [Microcoleus sp. herbarium2]|uniref:hypothetical protein n=1 Tax=Microcoleus sp. herbarium2 TaxID=3055433 RepID=UPI002FD18502
MKIIQKTEHILKLKNKDLIGMLFEAVFWGTVFLGLPLYMILMGIYYSGVEKLSCKKIESKIANCELSTSHFMGLVKGELNSLKQVHEAKVYKINTTDIEGASTVKENVFLVTSQGDVSLPYQTVKDAELFNKYIQTSVGTLIIEKDRRWSYVGSILVIGCFVVSFIDPIDFFHYLFSVETYIFDNNASTLTIKKRGIMVNEVTERSLSEISEVKLEEVEVHKTEHMDAYTSYQVRLLMNGGDILSLGGSSNQKEQKKMADLIRSYLDGRSPKSITSDK